MTALLSQTLDRSRPQAAAPMLARVADAMYWMSRYVERSEHIARILVENEFVLMDVGDLTPQLKREFWRGLLCIFNIDQTPTAERLLGLAGEELPRAVARFMTMDAANPDSLASCLTRARENARSIREHIHGEMWENLNALYWSLQGDEARQTFDESRQDLHRDISTGAVLFHGLADQMLSQGQGWLFILLARFLERIDMTCRLIVAKHQVLAAAGESLEAAVRSIHWMSVLRSTGSLEAYRRACAGDMGNARVVEFLVLEAGFPRSIRYCVQRAHDAAARIRAGINPHHPDAAERILGRLSTQLEYAEAVDIEAAGLCPFLRAIQLGIAQAADAIRKSYFLY